LKTIRAGRGLGDSIYLASIVTHFGLHGGRLCVLSDHPDVFRHTPGARAVEPFDRNGVDIVSHYVMGKRNTKTTQFQDMVAAAGITEEVPLRLMWRKGTPSLIDGLRADGRPVVCVQMPRAPMGRTDGFGAELMPDFEVMQSVVDAVGKHASIVQIGGGAPLFYFRGLTMNLANGTTVEQLIDIAQAADGFIGYPSFVIPLAESFRKPLFAIWAKAGLRSNTDFIRLITPEKVVHHKEDAFVITDKNNQQEISERVDAFLHRLQ